MTLYSASAPIRPTKVGGPWVSAVIDVGSGDRIPTGSIHPTHKEAWDYAVLVSKDWSNKPKNSLWARFMRLFY